MGAANTANILDKYKKKKKADTLIFPNEDFIYVMKWKEKKHNYFENIFMSTKKLGKQIF